MCSFFRKVYLVNKPFILCCAICKIKILEKITHPPNPKNVVEYFPRRFLR